jgi:hypothetical protein
MFLGVVEDRFFDIPLTVEWNKEGRISPIYDSRLDLMEPIK